MRIVYTFSIRLLYLVIWIAQFFNPKAKKWIAGRKPGFTPYPKIEADRKVIWFHCASLGEFDQGLPLMKLLKEKDPSLFLVVTFFSPSGFENYNKRQHMVDFACYFPLDTSSNAKTFLNHFKVKQAFFVKYEFWANFIFEAKNQGIKIYSVCTIFREKHRFFKWYGGFFRKTLKLIDYFFVQNKQSLELLHSIGITKAKIVGDLRFDRVIENKKTLVPDPVLEQFIKHKNIWILGSSWSVDEAFLEEEINTFEGQLIIAPHDISEKHLLEIENRFPGNTIRYTQCRPDEDKKIIILDCIGKLANAYSFGTFAYVGGGFTGSLHNILEPAVFGLPVIFGPKHKRFPEAQLFIDQEVGFSVSTAEELNKTLQHTSIYQEQIKERIQLLIKENAGSSEKIVTQLEMN